MSYTEQALSFDCQDASLVGILTRPAAAPSATGNGAVGVLVVVGGPQYRVGSHRQFVLLARALALAGHPVLRFDYRGMGDSSGAPRDFTDVTPDIASAVGALQEAVPAVRGIVLWGLCDGASAALIYCQRTRDRRIAGLCLVNPWVRSEASLALTQVKHYYGQRLLQREFWRKLALGGIGWSAVRGLVHGLVVGLRRRPSADPMEQQPFQTRMALAWKAGMQPILLLLSGADYTAKEFLEVTRSDPAWAGALTQPTVHLVELPGADHTLSSAQWRIEAENQTLAWLARLATGSPNRAV